MNKIILKYIGTGSLIEIPARDLTEKDLKDIAWTGWNAEKLVASGLYQRVDTQYQVSEAKPKEKRGK